MFKDFLIKKMLKKQGVPDSQIDMIMGLMEKDPALFKKMADEIQVEVKKGKSQQDAAMYVMPKYQRELQALMKK